MSKRARYTGTSATMIAWPPGDVYNSEYSERVEPNHMVSSDAPAKLRDWLIKEHPDFTEVTESSAKTSSDKGDQSNG